MCFLGSHWWSSLLVSVKSGDAAFKNSLISLTPKDDIQETHLLIRHIAAAALAQVTFFFLYPPFYPSFNSKIEGSARVLIPDETFRKYRLVIHSLYPIFKVSLSVLE